MGTVSARDVIRAGVSASTRRGHGREQSWTAPGRAGRRRGGDAGHRVQFRPFGPVGRARSGDDGRGTRRGRGHVRVRAVSGGRGRHRAGHRELRDPGGARASRIGRRTDGGTARRCPPTAGRSDLGPGGVPRRWSRRRRSRPGGVLVRAADRRVAHDRGGGSTGVAVGHAVLRLPRGRSGRHRVVRHRPRHPGPAVGVGAGHLSLLRTGPQRLSGLRHLRHGHRCGRPGGGASGARLRALEPVRGLVRDPTRAGGAPSPPRSRPQCRARLGVSRRGRELRVARPGG